jgi:hypothetical protein
LYHIQQAVKLQHPTLRAWQERAKINKNKEMKRKTEILYERINVRARVLMEL